MQPIDFAIAVIICPLRYKYALVLSAQKNRDFGHWRAALFDYVVTRQRAQGEFRWPRCIATCMGKAVAPNKPS